MIKVEIAVSKEVTDEQLKAVTELIGGRLKKEFGINVSFETRHLGQTTNVLSADIRVELIYEEIESVVGDISTDTFQKDIKALFNGLLESLRFHFSRQQRVELMFIFLHAMWDRVGGIKKD